MDWNNAPVIAQPLLFPATSLIIGSNCLFWYLINRYGLDYGELGSSHQLVVIEHQWYRTITASFSHISIIHLFFNMSSTWQMKDVEHKIGALGYFRLTFSFLILSIFFQQFIHAFLAQTRYRDTTLHMIGVGYSCVVFAWMTWISLMTSGDSLDFVFFKVPYNLSPFISLVVTQMIIPRVDFVGHLSGIIAGYWQGWGLNSWLCDYWLTQVGIWTIIFFVASMVWSGKQVKFVEVCSLSEDERRQLTALDSSSTQGTSFV
mmetsp:Transcript_10385/g.24612  ORF Transcript_10385/g.24612 Transcript_10385/m.24612 type:complete len:260 (-) Transcript_10385:43-822(-)